jgi:hypothetical protein
MRQLDIARCASFCAAIVLAGYCGSLLCPDAFASSDITGLWAADNGAVYYARQGFSRGEGLATTGVLPWNIVPSVS